MTFIYGRDLNNLETLKTLIDLTILSVLKAVKSYWFSKTYIKIKYQNQQLNLKQLTYQKYSFYLWCSQLDLKLLF